MPFVKKKELLRRQKVSEANQKRKGEKRTRKRGDKVEATCVPAGRRVVDLALLSTSMWCVACDIPLSFRYLEKEDQKGLCSTFFVRCYECLTVFEIDSSTSMPAVAKGRPLYAINCKAALACIDSGVGHDQFNKLLSAMNIPSVQRNTMIAAQERVGNSLAVVAEESCKAAIAEEKELTLSDKSIQEALSTVSVDSPGGNTTPKRRPLREVSTNVAAQSAAPVDIVVKYDFGWDKRGSGFKYDSQSGRGSLIGNKTNKILGYEVLSSYCYKCARGHTSENHVCAKNYEGSAKGMEPKAAVKLCLKNPNLVEAGVRVKKLIGDRDASTIAALRQESPYVIEKIVDINHNTKSVNNALWNLKKGNHKFLTTVCIDYLKRCVNFAIKQNQNDVEGVRRAIMNIENHTFGEHDGCGEWCEAKGNLNYEYRFLPNNKPFQCPRWREDLRTILQTQADDAEKLAPAGSSLQNESFNHMCVTRAPKSRHYCGTKANFYRVSAAVCCKNLGANHLEKVYASAQLSPSAGIFRERVERRRLYKAAYQNQPINKKRRLHLKMKGNWSEAASERAGGLTYVSGMSNAMERAAAAATVPVTSWVPQVTELLPECEAVIVDIETTGLGASADIVQLAAKCGEKTFSVNIFPKANFCPRATAVTGMSVECGKLIQHGRWLPTVPASEAAKEFVEFLRKCSRQVILVGHNIIRFDAPRIMKFLKAHGFIRDVCSMTYGLCDTIPLIKQGKMQKQELLAQTYLKGPEWENVTARAHDALTDCILLDGLLQHFGVPKSKIIESVCPVRDFMERSAQLKKKKENTPALMVMSEHGVSKGMIGKMAETGITIDELFEVYEANGRKGLEVCLGVQLRGKPRVTRTKAVINKIESFLKSKM